MKRLRFQTRIYIGFSIILAFSLLIAVLSIIQIKSISSDTELIFKHPFAVSNAIKDINININAIHRSMKDVASAENTEELNNSVLLVNDYDSLIFASFKIIKERFLGDSSIVDDAYKSCKDWQQIRNKVVEFKKAENELAAQKITKEEGAEHVKLVFEKTKRLSDFAENKADELYKSTLNKRSKSITTLIITLISLLILSIVVSFVISKSISQPIHKFISDIKLLYSKKSPQKTEYNKKSEQEILSNTASELKTASDKLKSFNQELEQKVNDRTSELNEQNKEYAALNEEYKTANEELSFAKEKAEEKEILIKTQYNELIASEEEIRANNEELTLATDELKKHKDNLEKLVEERTNEINLKNKDLDEFNQLFIGREFRIKELRDQIKELKKDN